jgi:hypothetical protein
MRNGFGVRKIPSNVLTLHHSTVTAASNTFLPL